MERTQPHAPVERSCSPMHSASCMQFSQHAACAKVVLHVLDTAVACLT